jgi:hypothetical protein
MGSPTGRGCTRVGALRYEFESRHTFSYLYLDIILMITVTAGSQARSQPCREPWR